MIHIYVTNNRIIQNGGPGDQGVNNLTLDTMTSHQLNVALMLGHRLRRWLNIKSTLARRFLLGVSVFPLSSSFTTSRELLSQFSRKL